MSRLEAALRRAQAQNQEPHIPTSAPVREPPREMRPREAVTERDARNERDAQSERLARAITSLTVEAPASNAPPVPSPLGMAGAGAEKLVVASRPEQSTVEQYRKLAATLHHAQVERDLKVVMVSSAVSGDGKTLTSTNLALTLSESYRRRVLLIDADLRRPSVHEVFQVKNQNGLTECLAAETERRLPLIQASPYLSLLLAGRPDSDPMSGLTSGRMHRLIGEAAATFDWVIIDTPPVVLLPDANLLAAMVDAAILVIGAGKTPYKLITRAVDALGRNKILGVVLNRVDRSCLVGGYGYGYYSYGER
jgi:capsular exopolysaccharide synthesis family protein